MVSVVVVLGLFVTGPDINQGEVVRILYVHPAVAWVAYVAFGITTLASLLWLWPRTRAPKWDQIAGASAEVGVIFTALTLVLGAIWGRTTWGVWWTWDARVTSTALLLFMYLGVLALRRVPASREARGRRSGVAALIAFLDVPVVHFSVNWWRTLHQPASVLKPDILNPEVHGLQLFTMLFSFLAFTVVYVWLLILRYRIARWEDQLEEGGLDAAIASRRAEGRSPALTPTTAGSGSVATVGSVSGGSAS
jgi:heme exporter protein C